MYRMTVDSGLIVVGFITMVYIILGTDFIIFQFDFFPRSLRRLLNFFNNFRRQSINLGIALSVPSILSKTTEVRSYKRKQENKNSTKKVTKNKEKKKENKNSTKKAIKKPRERERKLELDQESDQKIKKKAFFFS